MRKVTVVLLTLGLWVAAVPGGAQAPGLFDPYQAFPVGSWPESVAVGDVNDDGRDDVALTTGAYFDPVNDQKLFVFYQEDSGALAPPISYPTSATGADDPESVDIGDVTGDGRADVVVGINRRGFEVFAQQPDGTLGASTWYATPDSLRIRVGDLNDDGLADVAGVGWATGTVAVFLQNPSGTLDGPTVLTVEHSGYEDLELGDVTGDARTDIVVMSGQNYATPNVGILPQAAGGFGPPAYYRVGDNINTRGLGVGDVTGDGRNDVVVSYGGNRPASHLGVFAQNSAGLLDPVVAYPAYDIPEPVAVADLDLDGLADAVTAHGGWNNAGVFRQAPDGTLQTEELYPIPYASHYNPHGLDIGDVDGNGAPDLAIADYNNGLIILYNSTSVPPQPGTADLAVTLLRSAKSIRTGDAFSFTARVVNLGPDPASSVRLTVEVTGPHRPLNVTDPACGAVGDLVSCTFDSLDPSSGRAVVISGVASARGNLAATASVASIDDDPRLKNNTDRSKIRVR